MIYIVFFFLGLCLGYLVVHTFNNIEERCNNSIKNLFIVISNGLLWLLAVVMIMGNDNLYSGNIIYTLITAIFSSILLAIFFIDLKYFIIPDKLVIAIIIISFPLFFIDTNILWSHRLIGFLTGGGILYLLAVLSEVFLKKEGMGGGDIKMMAGCGLILGYKNIILALFLSSIIALIVIFSMYPFKKKIPDTIPFGPFLAMAVIICHYFGDSIINFYFGLFVI